MIANQSTRSTTQNNTVLEGKQNRRKKIVLSQEGLPLPLQVRSPFSMISVVMKVYERKRVQMVHARTQWSVSRAQCG
jgi:hypothetical protein